MSIAEDLKQEQTRAITLTAQAKKLYGELEAKGQDKVTQEERNQLKAMIDDGFKLNDRIEELKKLVVLEEKFKVTPASEPKGKDQGTEPQDAGIPGLIRIPTKTWGSLIAESKEFKSNDSRNMNPVNVFSVNNIVRKALYSGSDAQGGYLTVNDRLPDILDIARQRPLTVLDLFNQSTTASDAVDFVSMSSRTNNAAVVTEYDTGTSSFGLKPESNITFALQTTAVKTIATWIPASRQVLADAPRLRAMVDSELTFMVMTKLEDQTISGNGTSPNFLGLLNTSGIQTRFKDATAPTGRGQLTTSNLHDTLRMAITDIRLSFYEPDAIVLNPAQSEALELEKDGNGNYLRMFDPVALRLWRVPVVESPAMPSGTAVVGAFRLGATLWDRMATEIRVAEQHADFFIRNAVVILADLRAAFAVTRPLAFEKVTGL